MANQNNRRNWQKRAVNARGLTEFLLISVATTLISSQSFVTPTLAQDYYKVLGLESQQVSRGAILKAIKKKRAQFNPEKEENKGDEGVNERFEDVIRAEEIFLNNDRKQIYDHYGIDELEKRERGSQGKGPTIKVTIGVELEDLYKGKPHSQSVKRKIQCKACHGTGAEGGVMKICPKCKGHGKTIEKVQMGPMVVNMEQVCHTCGGRGKSSKAVCSVCNGHKLVPDNQKIDFDIKPGSKNREQIHYKGMGETDLNSDEPGDVIFQLRQRKHHKFRRIGNNLYHNVNINFKESVLGFERTVKTLDGRNLKVKIAGDQLPVGPNTWYVIPKEGMPIKDSWNSFGDLHVKWLVNFPRSVTPKQKQFVKRIFPHEDDTPDEEEEEEEEDEVVTKAEEL